MATLVATGGLAMSANGAIAQNAPNVYHDTTSGAVRVDNNAFDVRTGAFENRSNIPMPAILPADVQEGVSLPVRTDTLAPNSAKITPNVNYINQAFNEAVNSESSADRVSYQLDYDSLQLMTQFDLNHQRGGHAYGEGIEAIVLDADGNVITRESTFVRGDKVKVGPDGQPLPEASQITTFYGANDTVELRVLNIRRDGENPSESGLYFTRDGEFIVEDFQDGGDDDFNDGNYVRVSGGQGEALTLEERDRTSVETEVTETPLDPEVRQEELVRTEVVESIEESDTISNEEKTWGSVELTNDNAPITHLGHARGAVGENGENLVYDRYSSARQVRAGSDGLSFTGQLAPLFKNPSAPPTLLSGEVTFNPFVDDNEAGLLGSLSVTQFLNPTHRLATDALGNVVNNPNPDGPRLVEPAGLFSNRRLVGYVPPTPDETVMGDQLSSTNGIFNLPADQSIVITPADPQTVGRGDSAYTDNVGGVLIEKASGDLSFVPQWSQNGYAQSPISLAAGEASRIIYALVPQQAGQALQIGRTYDVSAGAGGYQIAEGGFTVISADQQPQNFVRETAEVYMVEDTLSGQNAVTALFNGVQGVYAEAPGSTPVPTVDVGLAYDADARVGNTLFPMETVIGEPGQNAYGKTTIAAGFYLGGSVTGGVGNQRDTVTQTDSIVGLAVNELVTTRTTNMFMTPVVQQDSVQTARTETIQTPGTAYFDIDRQGELTNARFLQGDSRVSSTSSLEVDRETTLLRGPERLVSSETSETSEFLGSQLIELDQETNSESESSPNFSAVRGELALGGVLNFGNTPWTAAANTVRAELFARDTVIGRSNNDAETGWRAEVMFHPFGEVQREAFQYDEQGNVVPVYQTEAVMDASGQQVMETLTGVEDKAVEVAVNQFALDESGNRIAQTVGTGQAAGPGVYLRVEDVFNGDEGVQVAGGVQFSF
ncbi:MAG: hypothetical protein WBC73_01135 [Phormidesmis sp.]